MSDGLRETCIICGDKAVSWFPMLPQAPAFCDGHYNQRDAGKYGCDLSSTDNDLQWEDWALLDDDFVEVVYDRDTFQWKDKEGRKLLLEDIDDYYLQNIINFLKRKEEPKFKLIAFLEKEQEIRKQEATK